MAMTNLKDNDDRTRKLLLTILMIAPLFISGAVANQAVFAGGLNDPTVDDDGDGFSDDGSIGGLPDCDDTDPTVFPGAPETAYDGIDSDCDGSSLDDEDGDGSPADQAQGGTPDCDDTDNTVFPGAVELDDGKDNNCDSVIDEGLDGDGDGFTPIFGGDCDDTDPAINPGADEIPNDGVDNNCDGAEALSESAGGLFWKEVQIECADGLDIAGPVPLDCDLWITYHDVGDNGPGTIIDVIPAHLDVLDVTGDAECSFEFSNANGKSQGNAADKKPRKASSTIVTCEDVEEGDMIHIDAKTRPSPSGKIKYSPTSCGEFEVNGGLVYYEGVDQFGIPIILDTMDPAFVHTTPDDLDCDGVPNASDLCEGFDDAVDTDGDGVPDGCDLCQGDDATGNDDGDLFCNDLDNCDAIPDDTNACQI